MEMTSEHLNINYRQKEVAESLQFDREITLM